jgi:DNA repair protein RecN (Recombination protein N)
MVSLDPSLEKLAQRIESLRLELIDVAGDVSHYGRDIEPNPERLALLDERVGALERLKRKHGGELTDVLEHARNLESSLDTFENLEEAMIAAQNATDAAYQTACQQAQALSTARRTAADVLEQVVATQLTDLAMKEAALSIALEPSDSLTAHGMDQGEFLVRTNPGEPFRALSRVASGGEVSRLLLAMKRALCQTEETHCLVFDEVDTGVGGAVAEVVGLKLREISQEKQVIAITHLPQIAALGDHHALVMKHQDGHRARTEVQGLDHSQRTAELARMLGGRTISDQTWAHAAELLRASHHAAPN